MPIKSLEISVTDNRELSKYENQTAPRIVVVGLGGAGGNAANNMIQSKLTGVEILVANTDAQALRQSLCERCIQMGRGNSLGLGAGSSAEIGRAATEEALDDILTELEGANMVFITAGMGGGTGTGGAPVIARAAREAGILTVGVVTKPFHFEGARRMRVAEAGITELTQYVDTLIVIPNQNLFRIANEKTTFADAFKMADDVLYSGVRGVTDLMVMPGLINLDFADIRAVMAEKGKAMMGAGEAEGDGRALLAAEAAVSNPLLDDVSLKGARAVLVNITGGPDMTLFEVDEATSHIRDEVDPEANIIFGSTFDQGLEGRMRVSLVATDIEAERAEQPKPTTLNLVTSPAVATLIPAPAEGCQAADAELVTSPAAATLVPAPAEECQAADAEIAIEQLTRNQPAEDRPEDRQSDRQPANSKSAAAVPFTGDDANTEGASEQHPDTDGGIGGEKNGAQGSHGVRYVVWDRELETKIFKIRTIQEARVRSEPHAENLEVFASLEEAKEAADTILNRIPVLRKGNGRSTYSTSACQANLMYQAETEVLNYFV
jgi:cell division protein FtsZ